MKKILFLIPFILFFSCSAPKFAANQTTEDAIIAGASNASSKQATDGESVLTASTKATPSLAIEEARAEIKKNYLKLSKEERKEVRQLLKKEIKKMMKVQKSQKKEMAVSSTQASGIDHDLKLAAIFGAVGVVGLLLGSAGQFFTIIGAISLIIGTVFFVKWLLEQ
ncbi:MAG: hypothetical protein ACK5RG_22000 [Cyclobacteriaceae bacterium]|jgi:hypothetical protein|nr:hypothetical protein [Flammeovirgaceae bacterium]